MFRFFCMIYFFIKKLVELASVTYLKDFFMSFQSAQNRLYIKKGRIVNHDSVQNGDVYIEDGKIK